MTKFTARPVAISRRAFVCDGTLFLLAAAGGSVARLVEAAEDAQKNRSLQIGLLTDLHYADKPSVGSLCYRETIAKIREAVAKFSEVRVDFAIELGDLIDEAETVEGEIGFLKMIAAEFAKFTGERHYVLGNHCVWTLTKKQFLDNSGAKKERESFDRGGFHFVILDSCFRADGVAYGAKNNKWEDADIPAEERDWLRDDLAATKLPTLVFVHHRLDVTTTYAIKSREAVRKILEDSGKVLAVFQGHNHVNDHREIGGIHYCTLNAMIEGSGEANSAYALLDIFADGSLRVTGFRHQNSYDWPTRR